MKHITCLKFKETYQDDRHTLVLDVRSSDEYKQGHIPGAINVPIQELQKKAKDIIPSLSTPVVCCCASGGRSLIACVALEDLGFTNVMQLSGGYHKYCMDE